LRLTPDGKDRAQAEIAQIQSAPEQYAYIDRKENVTEEWKPDAQVGCDGATEVAGEQNRAENRGSRDGVEDNADQLDDSESWRETRRPSEIGECLIDGTDSYDVDDGVEQ